MIVGRLLKHLLVIASIINASPSLAQLRPEIGAPAVVEDDLMGSGREIPQNTANLGARRPPPRRPPEGPRAASAIFAIRAARAELLRREPELGTTLALTLPRLRRDDLVGTMVRSANAIRFNPKYVMSLTQSQLLNHIWQLAVSLQTPL